MAPRTEVLARGVVSRRTQAANPGELSGLSISDPVSHTGAEQGHVMTAAVGYGEALTWAEPAVATREEGFRVLYQAEFSGLAGYVTAMVGDVHLARDIAQEAFARLFARWVGVREPKAYVYYVATNIARRHWRRSAREREIYAEIHARPVAESPQHDPWLRDLVERLPDRLREVVLLHYYADLPVAEIAELTRRPVGTVKRRLHEARGLLALSMGACDD